jgi:hypothetical protein
VPPFKPGYCSSGGFGLNPMRQVGKPVPSLLVAVISSPYQGSTLNLPAAMMISSGRLVPPQLPWKSYGSTQFRRKKNDFSYFW